MKRTEVAPADEAKVVDLVCMEIDSVADRITTEASWEQLTQFFYNELMRTRTLPSETILLWAEAGHPAAHNAVLLYVSDMMDTNRESELLVRLKGYAIRFLRAGPMQAFRPFPQGRHVVQNLMRDAWVPLVMQHVADATGVPPTRSRSTVAPSAGYFLWRACKRKGFKIKEQQLNRLYWRRDTWPARLEASMPPLPPADPSPFK